MSASLKQYWIKNVEIPTLYTLFFAIFEKASLPHFACQMCQGWSWCRSDPIKKYLCQIDSGN